MRRMSAGRVAGTPESEEQTVFDVNSRKTRFQFANGLNRDKQMKCFVIVHPLFNADEYVLQQM